MVSQVCRSLIFPAASKNFPFFFLGGKCSLAQHSGERWERLRVGAFNGCFSAYHSGFAWVLSAGAFPSRFSSYAG